MVRNYTFDFGTQQNQMPKTIDLDEDEKLETKNKLKAILNSMDSRKEQKEVERERKNFILLCWISRELSKFSPKAKSVSAVDRLSSKHHKSDSQCIDISCPDSLPSGDV